MKRQTRNCYHAVAYTTVPDSCASLPIRTTRLETLSYRTLTSLPVLAVSLHVGQRYEDESD